jgi:hypothetical protein
MRHLPLFTLVLALFTAGCKPTAASVCTKLEEAGVAAGCIPKTPGGIGAGAKEATDFQLPSVPGKGGSTYSFDNDAQYEATVKNFESFAGLAGPHRYGNPKARIFVQLTKDTPTAVGVKAKAVVDAL